MNEVKVSLSDCLMQSWKKGWPEYFEDPSQDHVIVKLGEKVANDVRVDITDSEGLERTCKGITTIATFCRTNVPWCFKNIYYANMCFPTLYNHMKSQARLKKIRSSGYNYNK